MRQSEILQLNTSLEIVRLVAAGSVDDGKSTLIGRLLYECGALYKDQFQSIEKISSSRTANTIDFSLLTDGLSAEREQSITIDVAYRYFTLGKRRYIIADVPGHEQYTRNMVTGASNANIALILVDATKGVLLQTKRHLLLVSLLRIPHVLIVINKMDLVNFNPDIFYALKERVSHHIAKLALADVQYMPISAASGEMVTSRGNQMQWYHGFTLREYLQAVETAGDKNLIDFRLAIQSVMRNENGLRAYSGRIMSGGIKQGDDVLIAPQGTHTRIKSLFVGKTEIKCASNGQSIAVTLEDERDVSRGDVLMKIENKPVNSRLFECLLFWMDDAPMSKYKSYFIKHSCTCVRARISVRYHLNCDTLHREDVNTLTINQIGRATIETSSALSLDPYSKNTGLGQFIIIDESTQRTVAAGIVTDKIPVQTSGESALMKYGAPVLWFTGLSGSGKSTVAKNLAERLSSRGIALEILDGDQIRELFGNDLGFAPNDRDKNIGRAVALASLLSRHGVWVLCAFISPYRSHRQLVRDKIRNVHEIFIDAPLEVCEQRDTKGLYAKARSGEIPQFTGISDRYDQPVAPDLHLKTFELSVEESVTNIMSYLERRNYV